MFMYMKYPMNWEKLSNDQRLPEAPIAKVPTRLAPIADPTIVFTTGAKGARSWSPGLGRIF